MALDVQNDRASPPFGGADLSNCEKEQIHLAGSIQSHAALLVVREPDLVVVQASANAARLLAHEGEILGAELRVIASELADRIATRPRRSSAR